MLLVPSNMRIMVQYIVQQTATTNDRVFLVLSTMVSSKPAPSRLSWTSQIIWLLVALMAFVLGIQTGLSSHVACSTTTTTATTTSLAASLPSKSGAVVPANDDDKKSFELAKRHSFGFFDDINDYNWKLMQQRAASRKHHKFKDPLKFYWEPARWYMNNFEPDFTCPQERRLGGPGDGPKWVSFLFVMSDRFCCSAASVSCCMYPLCLTHTHALLLLIVGANKIGV